jgi:hypothetical protein
LTAPTRPGRCWAHQGPPKSAQKHKVLADAFKLAWIATTVYPRPQLILCLSDPLATRQRSNAGTAVLKGIAVGTVA